jgi:hypothetical protein
MIPGTCFQLCSKIFHNYFCKAPLVSKPVGCWIPEKELLLSTFSWHWAVKEESKKDLFGKSVQKTLIFQAVSQAAWAESPAGSIKVGGPMLRASNQEGQGCA